MLLLAVAIWWAFHDARTEPAAPVVPAPVAAAPAASGQAPARSSPPPVAEPAPAPAEPPPAPATPDAAVANDELPPSHPITPAHVRIQRENNLIGAMNGAMDVDDGAGLRNLLDQYRQEYPDDPSQLQEGYAIIADCLQRPGAASTAAGQRYFDRERGSILRRFVARHCQLP